MALGRREDLPVELVTAVAADWQLGNRTSERQNAVFATQIPFIILGVALFSTKVAALSPLDQEDNSMMLS